MRQDRGTVGTYELEFSPDGGISVLSVSRELLELHGFDESEVYGLNTWPMAVDPEDLDYLSQIPEQVLANDGWVGRVRTRSKDGSKFILELDNKVERVGGRVLVHGTARDITAQAELEAAVRAEETKLRLLSEKIPVVLWSTDRHLRFTWTLGQGLDALGANAPGMVGLTLQEFFQTEDDGYAPIAGHARVISKGESVSYSFEWSDRVWRCWIEPSRDELGNISGAIGVGIDVTATETLEAQALAVGREIAHLAVAAATSTAEPGTARSPGVVSSGGLRIDIESHKVTMDGETVGLTPTEFKLLVALARRADRVVERQHLLESVWGYDFSGGESPLSMTVKRLREKIESDPQNPQLARDHQRSGLPLELLLRGHETVTELLVTRARIVRDTINATWFREPSLLPTPRAGIPTRWLSGTPGPVPSGSVPGPTHLTPSGEASP